MLRAREFSGSEPTEGGAHSLFLSEMNSRDAPAYEDPPHVFFDDLTEFSDYDDRRSEDVPAESVYSGGTLHSDRDEPF